MSPRPSSSGPPSPRPQCTRCGKTWPRGLVRCPDDGASLRIVAADSLDAATPTAIVAPFAGSRTDMVSPQRLKPPDRPSDSALDAPTTVSDSPFGVPTADSPFGGSITPMTDSPFGGTITPAAEQVPLPLRASGSVIPTSPLLRPMPEERAPRPASPVAPSVLAPSVLGPRRAATSHPDELEAGTRVGEYEVEGKIGEGAMGAVYRAVHPAIGKHVAVKIMHPRLSGDADAIERFTREARSVAAIHHPGIVDIFGFGTLDDGRVYLVMEWLEGTSLGARLLHGRLADHEALDVIQQLARAVTVAHEKGVIHRDLKPDNIFLQAVPGEPSVVKILDFGLAKLAAGGMEMTQSGQLLGTPIYMSPEQCRGKSVDHRTDVYALGCIAYELLCGRVPFEPDNLAELMAAHLTEAPPAPRALRPDLPPLLDRLLFAMVAKDPAARPSLAQIRQEIAMVRNGPAPMPGAVAQVRPGFTRAPSAIPPTPMPVAPWPPPGVAPRRSHRFVIITGSAVVVAIAAAIALIAAAIALTSMRSAEAPTAPDDAAAREELAAFVAAGSAASGVTVQPIEPALAPAPMPVSGEGDAPVEPAPANETVRRPTVPATVPEPAPPLESDPIEMEPAATPATSEPDEIAIAPPPTTLPADAAPRNAPSSGTPARPREAAYGTLQLDIIGTGCSILIDGTQKRGGTHMLPAGRRRVQVVGWGKAAEFFVDIKAGVTVVKEWPCKPKPTATSKPAIVSPWSTKDQSTEKPGAWSPNKLFPR